MPRPKTGKRWVSSLRTNYYFELQNNIKIINWHVLVFNFRVFVNIYYHCVTAYLFRYVLFEVNHVTLITWLQFQSRFQRIPLRRCIVIFFFCFWFCYCKLILCKYSWGRGELCLSLRLVRTRIAVSN